MILVGAVAATPAAGAARRPRRANRATWRLPGRLARVVACNNNRLRDDRWAPRAPPRGRDADATRRRAAVDDASAPRRREDDEPADAPAVPAMDVVAPPRSVLADPDAFRAARAEASNAVRNESALDASSKTRGAAAAMRASAAVLLGGAALFAAAAALPLDVLPGVAPRAAVAATATASAATATDDADSDSSSLLRRKPPSTSNGAYYNEFGWRDHAQYRMAKIFALPLLGKIAFFFLLVAPMVLVGGVLYKIVDKDETWSDAIMTSFYLLNNVPGADATTDTTPHREIVTQFIVFVGIFLFAVIIGIISDEIASKVEEVKTGNSTVVETGHTVIMNWNAQLVPLLKQLAVAKAERPGTFDAPIVILANVDKASMDETIAEELADSPPLDVVTRQGDPFVAEDLSRVNAFAARRVVVLHPETAEDYDGDGIEAADLSGEIDAARLSQLKDPFESVSELSKRRQLEEANKATVVMNLRGAIDRAGGGGANPELIVQMPYRVADSADLVAHAMDVTRRRELRDAGVERVVDIPSAEKRFEAMRVSGALSPAAARTPDACVQLECGDQLGKICAFSAFKPGTSRVFKTLFSQDAESPEIYPHRVPELVGKTFGEAWRMCPEATLFGILHADGSVTLAPDDDHVIVITDEPVFLAESSNIEVTSADASGCPPRGSQREHMLAFETSAAGVKAAAATRAPMKILFAGWNASAKTAVDLFVAEAPHGSEVTILASAKSIPPDEMASLRSSKNCKVKHVVGSHVKNADLRRAGAATHDVILAFPNHALANAEEDASVLATVLQTHSIASQLAEARDDQNFAMPRLVATMKTSSGEHTLRRIYESIGHDLDLDLVMSNDLIGGALAQVAACSNLATLFDALLIDDETYEVYLRDGTSALGAPDARTGAAATWGEICERAREQSELALGILTRDGDVVLSPAKADVVEVNDGDQIIVLAEEIDFVPWRARGDDAQLATATAAAGRRGKRETTRNERSKAREERKREAAERRRARMEGKKATAVAV